MRHQTKLEEQLNAGTHAIGSVLGIIAIILMLFRLNSNIAYGRFSVIVYGASIIILFLASTLYHSVTSEKRKHYFRIIDHISIYLLIAGTYTPILLLSLPQSKGWLLFWVVWAIALFGVILKIFFTGKFEIFSTLLYLVMGWIIIFDFSNLSKALGPNGILLLFGGGLFYTVGILFYALQRIPYNHVIWHLFVLGGAMSHFFMIYHYVI